MTTGVVALIGLPGAGKSTIGRRLAEQLGVAFVDLDSEIEQRAGCTIAELFERHGESGFRELESQALVETVIRDTCVIATGGGVVVCEGNRSLLAARAYCIYLRAPLSLLLRRVVRNRRRPLFRVGDPAERLRALALEREPLYLSTANAVVDVDRRSADDVVVELLALVGSRQ